MAITVTFDEVYGIAFRFGIWFGIGIFFSILFSTFRPQNPDFYAPKTKDQIVKELPPSFLSWVSSMTSISETRNVEMIGQDAVMFLKFMQLGQNLFMKLSVIAIPLILVNYYAPVIMNTPEETKTIPALTLLTMANIKKGSGLFYLHTVYTYLTTFMVFYAMVQIWNFYVPMRQEYLNSTEYTDNECFKTILFTQVPVEMRNGEAIQQYCDKYGITVTSSHVKIGKHLESLRKLIQCHSDKVSQFENVLVHHFKGTKPKPLHRLYEYQSEIQTIETKIKEARLQGYESFENAPYVLISFDTVASAHYAVQCLEPGPITVLLCRRPNDLVWKNLEIEPPHRTKRSIIAIVINVSLYIFWFCFVWFIGTFKKPSRLRLIWPQLETILLNDTILRIFIESYLGPVCVIITNFILLPRIMTKVSDLQLAPSATDIGHSSLRKFYTFLFYQRVLEVLMPLGESFFLNLRGSPAQAIQLAWASFSTVFVANGSTYIDVMVRGFNSYGMEIIQGAPLFWFYLAKHVQTSTPRTLSTLSETREFQYMKTYGFAQFLFLVCISYSIVAPFVLFSTVIIFSFGYIIMKYQLFYVYQTKKEGGGEWWPIAFGLLCISIAFFQIVTFFSLATIAGVDTPPAIYVTVLPVVTGVFWYACVRYYTPKTRFVKRSRSILETKTTECAIVDPVMNQELFKVWLDEPYESEWQKCQSDSDSDSATLGQ